MAGCSWLKEVVCFGVNISQDGNAQGAQITAPRAASARPSATIFYEKRLQAN